MNEYENGKIYKVIDENDDIIYVGSTKNTLKDRWSGHKLKCDEYKIVLIENYSCESKTELRKMEQKFIDLYKEMGLLNQCKAYQSKEERKKYKKEYNKAHQKEYEKNDKRKEYKKRKEKCPYCDKILNKRYIKTHIKSVCKNKDNF